MFPDYREDDFLPQRWRYLLIVIASRLKIQAGPNFYFSFFFLGGKGEHRSIQNLKLTQFFSSFLNCLFKTECRSLGGQNRLVKLNATHLPPLSLFPSLSRGGSKDTCLKKNCFFESQRERKKEKDIVKTNFNRVKNIIRNFIWFDAICRTRENIKLSFD